MEPDDLEPFALQQQVDELANDLLARGIQPTPMMLERRLTVPRRRLVEALEQWARRLGDDEAAQNARKTSRAAIRLVRPREQFARAALAASRAAASVKERGQRQERRAELLTEIERARMRLARLEEHLENGRGSAHLRAAIAKLRTRLQQMNEALDKPI